MSVTFPVGLSRQVNRGVLMATLAFGALGFAALIVLALAHREGRLTAPALVYGASLALCSLFSFLYNMLETAKRRHILRKLDHAAIFVLIAGTYTPFAAIGMHGPFGASLLAAVWTVAAAGMAMKFLLPRSMERAFTFAYLAMGWICISAIREILRLVPVLPLTLLAVGGLAFTIGALIYARDIGRWTDPVWHGFVLAGSIAHFLAVVAFCLPTTA